MFTMCHRGNNEREHLLLPVFVLFIAQQCHVVCLLCAIEEIIQEKTSVVASICIIHCSARSCGMFNRCNRGNNKREPLLLPVFVLFIAQQQGQMVCLLC